MDINREVLEKFFNRGELSPSSIHELTQADWVKGVLLFLQDNSIIEKLFPIRDGVPHDDTALCRLKFYEVINQLHWLLKISEDYISAEFKDIHKKYTNLKTKYDNLCYTLSEIDTLMQDANDTLKEFTESAKNSDWD